jgi:hypothetical protein
MEAIRLQRVGHAACAGKTELLTPNMKKAEGGKTKMERG